MLSGETAGVKRASYTPVSMKPRFATLSLLVCGAIGLGAWWWVRAPAHVSPLSESPGAGDAVSNQAARGADAAKNAATPSGTPPRPGSGPAPGPQPPDYRAQLRASDDYWVLAESLIGAARQGDAAAQFYLSNALQYCESLYDWYFVEHLPGGAARQRTLDEALQLTATRPVFTADDVGKLQRRCQRLRAGAQTPFGTAREWLDAAIQARYPVAQVSASLNKAMQVRQQPTPEASNAVRQDAQQLAFEALRTHDPDVMARMGDVAANLVSDPEEARKVAWVWRLAACQRETACDSMTDWLRLFCNIDTQCQPFETPVDIIRRKSGNDFDEIERRARELNEKIDAGTFEAGDL